MQQLTLQQQPNQSVSSLLDGNQWDFTFKTVQDITIASITLNGNDILDSARCVAGAFVIPSEYEENGAGNFFFVTQSNQLPFYTQFGVTQSLIYITGAELAALRAPSSSPIITAANFNPIAALPLRFSPKNYILA